MLVVADERTRSQATVREIVDGPGDASVECESTGFGVDAIESAERDLAASGNGRLVSKPERRGRAPGKTSVSADRATGVEPPLHGYVVAVARVVESDAGSFIRIGEGGYRLPGAPAIHADVCTVGELRAIECGCACNDVFGVLGGDGNR